MKIKLEINTKDLIKTLDHIEKRQAPFALSRSLNNLAFTISRQRMPKLADKIFEGGATVFTKRGFKYIKSTKRKLYAYVHIPGKQDEYMKYMIEGGTRKPDKRAILSTTSKSKLNKYGNFTKSLTQSMVSNKDKYFSGIPKGFSASKANEGIWERYAGGKRIRQVARYKDEQHYEPKFPFHKIAYKEVKNRSRGIVPVFKKNLALALKPPNR